MDSRGNDTVLPVPGFPIRRSPDQSLLSGSPKLIAASHALHRLLAPRHPPCALSSLTNMQEYPLRLHSPATRTDSRYSVVKDREGPNVLRCRVSAELTSLRTPCIEALRRVSYAADGADGDRTHDPRLAKPVLSQLSYSPIRHGPR